VSAGPDGIVLETRGLADAAQLDQHGQAAGRCRIGFRQQARPPPADVAIVRGILARVETDKSIGRWERWPWPSTGGCTTTEPRCSRWAPNELPLTAHRLYKRSYGLLYRELPRMGNQEKNPVFYRVF